MLPKTDNLRFLLKIIDKYPYPLIKSIYADHPSFKSMCKLLLYNRNSTLWTIVEAAVIENMIQIHPFCSTRIEYSTVLWYKIRLILQCKKELLHFKTVPCYNEF